MKTFIRFIASLILVSACFTCAAEEIRPIVALNSILETLRFNRASALLFGPGQSCIGQVDCSAVVQVAELFDSGGTLVACAAQASDITIRYAPGPHPGAQTTVTWNLLNPIVHNPPTQAKYEFVTPRGLLIVKDVDGATRGAGDTLDPPTQVVVVNKWKRRGGRVEYYPLVMQTRADGTKYLCGAGDPIMVND